jgi:hypothetical protein
MLRTDGFVAFFALAMLAGCSTSVYAPAGASPTPSSITHDNPGGDAPDPHEAALQRQLTKRWGYQEDKDGQLRVPIVDYKNWERVRYWVVDHLVGFKYGDDYHVLNAVFMIDLPAGTKPEPRSCMMRAEKWLYPQLKNFEVKLGEAEYSENTWHDHEVMVKSVDGYVDFGFERRRFSAAYAAYDAYPDACMIFGVAVPWREHEELAKKVRDRWIHEAVPLIRPMTPTRPFRK